MQMINRFKFVSPKVISIIRRFITRNRLRALLTLVKVSDFMLITRRFKSLSYRKSVGNFDTKLNFIITFKIKRRIGLNDKLMENSTRFKGSDCQFQPFLMINLHCKGNYLARCNEVLNLEEYFVDRRWRKVKEKLTMGSLTSMCETLMSEIFVIDNKIQFHVNPLNIFNSPKEIEKGVRNEGDNDGKYTEDEDAAENHNHIIDDNDCLVDIEPAKPPHQLTELDIRRIKMIQSVWRRIRFRNIVMRKKSPYENENLNTRKTLFNRIVKEKGNGIYYGIRCVVKKELDNKTLAVVQAYDFSNMEKYKELVLRESVLYDVDLNLEDIFRKIYLNDTKKRVEITEFNQYQIEMNKRIVAFNNGNKYVVQWLPKAFWNVKTFIQMRMFKLMGRKLMDKQSPIIITRFFKIYKKDEYTSFTFSIIISKTSKEESKMLINPVFQKNSSTQFFKTIECKAFDLKCESFRGKTYELEEYACDLKERLEFVG